ncbi:hypothetical protein [Corynebacterium sp. NML140438]|uniref:hypothetical protein n=1 Tax=Corynebacterium sp. NML140438 TaxID=1906334 RepID=UPI00116037F1|nr:hypothetical protein [Corynebacterium sp. NML140438]
MFNNRRLQGIAIALSLGACAMVAPSAEGATVGENVSGVCSIRLNAEETKLYEQSKGKAATFDVDKAWRIAFEDAFPAAKGHGEKLSNDLKTNFTFRQEFQPDPRPKLAELAKQVAEDAELPESVALDYITHKWSDAVTPGFENPGRLPEILEYDKYFEKGEIPASKQSFRAPTPVFPTIGDRDALIEAKKTQFKDLSDDQATAWVDQFENQEGLQDTRTMANVEAALNQAKDNCRDGKTGIVLFPTLHTNPDAVSQGAEGKARNKEQPTTTESSPKPSVSVDIQVNPLQGKTTVNPEPSKTVDTSDNSAALIGGIVGTIVVAILAVLGLSAAKML